jgi:hypothetical protein
MSEEKLERRMRLCEGNVYTIHTLLFLSIEVPMKRPAGASVLQIGGTGTTSTFLHIKIQDMT